MAGGPGRHCFVGQGSNDSDSSSSSLRILEAILVRGAVWTQASQARSF